MELGNAGEHELQLQFGVGQQQQFAFIAKAFSESPVILLSNPPLYV
jgi:ABC-type methionine transport system ATPase subunit